jgi:hypothetical protein
MSVQPTLTCQVVMFGGTVVSSTHITQAINPEHLLGHGEPKQLAETKLCALGCDSEANATGWLDSIQALSTKCRLSRQLVMWGLLLIRA